MFYSVHHRFILLALYITNILYTSVIMPRTPLRVLLTSLHPPLLQPYSQKLLNKPALYYLWAIP